MPGGNFDDVLTIQSGGQIFPAGPLGEAKATGEKTVSKLYVWVVQLKAKGGSAGGKGAYMQAEGSQLTTDPSRWETDPNTAIYQGQFVPGPALGTAVEITEDTSGEPDIYWWSEMIFLQT